MKLTKSQGHILRDPISTAFTMIEEGGSAIQQYDSIADEWVPDRTIAPMRFTPHLEVSDPQGNIPTGEHNEMLADCRWLLDGILLSSGDGISINSDTHALTFGRNLTIGGVSELVFTASVYDVRRGEMIPVRWTKVLSCQATTAANIKLYAVNEHKMLLNPFKDRGTFELEVQLYNGDTLVPDADAVYKWQLYEDKGGWRDISGDDLWCKGGANTRKLLVCQRYVQILRVRVLANAKAFPNLSRTCTFQLRRFYGQYHPELLWIEGKYKQPTTLRAVGEVQVSKNNMGAIADPEEYFDIETFYSRSEFQGFFHVSHTHRAEVSRSEFGEDSTAQHCFAFLVREKSAFMPLTAGGKVITIGGAALCTQIPMATREVE
ncbi:MAG: hypothetical protein J6C65_01940 [Prevotella sp.]|nr:hypothetical protein [Prevotella sp.]MBO5204779.1 hypothetical protein [Prevotella sp.]